MPEPAADTAIGRLQAWFARLTRRQIVRVGAILRGERTFYFALFILIGVVGGLVGTGVRWLGLALQRLYFASGDSLPEIARTLPWQACVLAPAGGALLVGIILHYLVRGSHGGGVAEIMEAVALRQRSLGLRDSLLKSLGSILMMSSGGSVGREGPSAALSASIATRIARLLHLTPARRNILIGCGVAAGMAAVYNAPLGASLFVMEVVIANFAMDVFGPLVVSAVMATLVSRLLWEAGPLYAVTSFDPAGISEYFVLGLLGIPCALMGNVFTTTLQRTTELWRSLKAHPLARITAGGLVVGVVGIWLPQVWGNGYDAVAGILSDGFSLQILAAICLGKILVTSVSIGSGGLGGAMTPTLLVGAAFGAACAHVLQMFGTGLSAEPGAYALVGMAGVLAATTHAPIMATFLTFELCQEYAMILPLGVCAGASALIARRWKKTSIYTERLARKGLDLDTAIEESALQAMRVEDVMWHDPPTVPPGLPARDVMERFLTLHRHLLHVVGDDGAYYGLIAVQDLHPAATQEELEHLVVALDLARPVPTVTPESPVSSIMERFWFQEFGELPVLRGTSPPRFAGVVTRRDILGAFDREVLRRRILTARYRMGPEPAATGLPLVGEYALEEVPVPPSLHGKTLAEAALPQRFRLTVVALKHGPPDATEEMIPPPLDRPFAPGDRLVLMGHRSDIVLFARE